MEKVTPMMQQYLEIKARHPDALLLYRMGDFYELFMEDAVEASGLLEIALTTRDRNSENPMPMCGVPYHAAESYIPKLIAAGKKVAICDQVEDPKKAKGLVRREVTRIITPGLVLDAQNLSPKQPNYLAAAVSVSAAPGTQQASPRARIGLAYLDISTADFRVVELESPEALMEELVRVAPRELLLCEDEAGDWIDAWSRQSHGTLTRLPPEDFDRKRSEERILGHFGIHSLDTFGIREMQTGVSASGAILSYIQANLLDSCTHITKLLPYDRSESMILDESTMRNLEIFQSQSFEGTRGSLLSVLDQTRTAMGGRRLRQWLRYPLLDLARIGLRQLAVAELVENPAISSALADLFAQMSDIERLNGRVSAGTASPRDMVALKRSLQLLPEVRERIERCTSPKLQAALEGWDNLGDVASRIEATLNDPPPATLMAGGVIRSGFHADLDRYARLSLDAKGWMAEYETSERQRTGIGSLKVRYNKVFGYYIEISRANLASAPAEYQRKQTLVNAERFITEELKTFEVQALEADERRLELEERLFTELRSETARESGRIQAMAEVIAEIDCVAALAEVATRNDYCRPRLNRSGILHIADGRHPVIERFLPPGSFVPNDLHMDQERQQVLIVTGPNMAGKSTILRQAALIVLMAQIGSFVPASEAEIGLVDRIFTRVGAADDLARGRSTFMVEMQETAYILHQATPESLVILDEIGRGTSTFDGLSIAWAVAEFLHDADGAGIKTLFATHYHELTELARTRPRVKNFNVAIKEWQHEIIFFHKLVAGGTNRSYGIQVARLAGLPTPVTDRAREVLGELEKGGNPIHSAAPPEPASPQAQPQAATSHGKSKAGLQLSLFKPSTEWLRDRILELDLDNLTPLAALQTLHALKDQIRGGIKPKAARSAPDRTNRGQHGAAEH